MKLKILTIALFTILTLGVGKIHAQESFGNIGIELAMPVGDFADGYGIGYGLSGGYEFGLGENFGMGLNVGYMFLNPKDVDIPNSPETFSQTGSIIPLQVYGRYYFNAVRTGLFLSVKAGAHIFTQSVETPDLYDMTTGEQILEGSDETQTDTYFSVAPELGVFLAPNVSLALRYQMITQVERVEINFSGQETESDAISYGYIGLHAAYNF